MARRKKKKKTLKFVSNQSWIRVTKITALSDQQNKCKYCRDPLTVTTTTADHVIPRKENGQDTKDNIVASCGPCNIAKGSMSYKKFMGYVTATEIPRVYFMGIKMAWARRRINMAVERSQRKILRMVGVKKDG